MPTTVAVKVSLSREGARLPKGAVALEPLAAIAGGCRTRAGRLPPATSLKQGLPGRRTASLSLTPNFRNGHITNTFTGSSRDTMYLNGIRRYHVHVCRHAPLTDGSRPQMWWPGCESARTVPPSLAA